MSEILRKQFLQHVGQTSPEPMLVEVERAEGVFSTPPRVNLTTTLSRACR